MFIEAANQGSAEVVTYKILKCCKNNETVDGVEIIRSGGRFTVYLKAPQYYRKHAGITLTKPTKQTKSNTDRFNYRYYNHISRWDRQDRCYQKGV